MNAALVETVDIAIVGAGAAGLMAAIWAGRTGPGCIVALDGARTIGAKILIAGGGRCNVTHHAVDEDQFAGSSRNAIKKVLRRFDVARTIEFFRDLGVELKREETGKLFPITDDAHTVLDALLAAVRGAGASIRHPWRVESVERDGDGFLIKPAQGGGAGVPPGIHAHRVILAAGGMALPKTGSDGRGYSIVRSLGHTTTPRIFPGLVPLTLPEGHFIRTLSGLTLSATLTLKSASGKHLVSFTNSTLCTHFGLSGPSVLDISRYYLDAAPQPAGGTSNDGGPGPRPVLAINFLPGWSVESLDTRLREASAVSAARLLSDPPLDLPERLARELCRVVGVDSSAPCHALTRDKRRALAAAATGLALPVTGDRGFTHAEVTAGGVPLSEVHLETMESRVCPGLYLCGEILDVDGRIGGFNFQWAWASGYVAGIAAGGPAPPRIVS